MDDVLILPGASASLVFGLDWLPLINGRASRVAYRIARRHGATHLVFSGETAPAVGLARLKLDRTQRGQVLNSAAQSVAHLFATGTIALLLELGPSRHWLVAVHEGAVVARTDRLFRCRSDAESVLEELKQAYPRLAMVGLPPSVDSVDLPLIESSSGRQARLLPVSHWHRALPRPIQWFVLILLLALLLPRLWKLMSPAARAPAAAQQMDPGKAWESALARASREIVVHGVQGTRTALHSLYDMPVRIAGWYLVNAACMPHARGWRCQARYDRRGSEASNELLLAKAPASWIIEFISIDQALSVWHIALADLPLSQHALKSSAGNERYLFSSLQAIQPAFTQIQLGRPRAIKVVPPRDAQGRILPRPAHLPAYSVRSVQISGPLRSGSLLLPYTDSMAWKKISLTVHDIGQAGLKSSRLTVSFQGDLYETESVRPSVEEREFSAGDLPEESHGMSRPDAAGPAWPGGRAGH
ncbi:hypothetical protein [Paralcaligenes ginsengisoli]